MVPFYRLIWEVLNYLRLALNHLYPNVCKILMSYWVVRHMVLGQRARITWTSLLGSSSSRMVCGDLSTTYIASVPGQGIGLVDWRIASLVLRYGSSSSSSCQVIVVSFPLRRLPNVGSPSVPFGHARGQGERLGFDRARTSLVGSAWVETHRATINIDLYLESLVQSHFGAHHNTRR